MKGTKWAVSRGDKYNQLLVETNTEEDDVTYVNLYPAEVLEVRVFPCDARALLYFSLWEWETWTTFRPHSAPAPASIF